jgi:hypothetical protein
MENGITSENESDEVFVIDLLLDRPHPKQPTVDL